MVLNNSIFTAASLGFTLPKAFQLSFVFMCYYDKNCQSLYPFTSCPLSCLLGAIMHLACTLYLLLSHIVSVFKLTVFFVRKRGVYKTRPQSLLALPYLEKPLLAFARYHLTISSNCCNAAAEPQYCIDAEQVLRCIWLGLL